MANAPRTGCGLSTVFDLSRPTISKRIREHNSISWSIRSHYLYTNGVRLPLEERDRLRGLSSDFEHLERTLPVLSPDTALETSLFTGEVSLADPALSHQPIDADAAVLERAISAYTGEFQRALATEGLPILEADGHALGRSIGPMADRWADVVYDQYRQATRSIPEPG